MQSHRPHRYFVTLCVLFSFGMSLFLGDVVFERLPHLEDELAYVYQARILVRGQLTVDSPDPRLAFWQPFVIDHDGQRFGKYPLGFPAQLALGELAGAPWMINALLGALAVALVYRLGSEIFHQRVGMIAALLLAFSPMALLLNATLMGHTSALCFTLLFMWAYRRIVVSRKTDDAAANFDEPSRALADAINGVPTGSPVGMPFMASVWWAVVAGVALGLVVANRPLAAVGIGLPYIAWSILSLWAAWRAGWGAFWWTLRPLVLMGAIVLAFAATIPLFSYATTGDPASNLYTLVWQYDRVGFGECCGRSGHSLERAFNHLRYDLSLLSVDLHGIQIGTFTSEVIEHLLREADTYPNPGLSLVLPLLGVLVAFWRVRGRLALWGVGAALWCALPLLLRDAFRTPASAWVWVGGAGGWVLLVGAWCVVRGAKKQRDKIASVGAHHENRSALALSHHALRTTHHNSHTSTLHERVVLLAVALMPVLVHMTYWVGSQRYSTRYYYEGIGALVLFSALALAWLTQRLRTRWTLALLVFGCGVTFITYSLPRVGALHGFNNVSQSWIDGARARAGEHDKLLVIVTGTELSWRAVGSFMAVTSPFLDSEIVGVYNRVSAPGEIGLREQVIAQFPDRAVVELTARGEEAQFAGE